MKNIFLSISLSIIYCAFFITPSISIAQECNLSDPLIGYEPELDPCCGFQESTSICYDIGALGFPWDDIAVQGPFTFVLQEVPQGSWISEEEFTSYEDLADLMDALSLSNGETVDFIWDATKQQICAYDVDFDYGYIRLCDGTQPECDFNFSGSSTNIVDVHPIVTEDYCPISEPEIDTEAFFDPENATIEDLTIFDGSGGDLSTQDILNVDFSDSPGPQANTIGAIMNSVVSSGALEYGAGCFNFNCLDLGSMSDNLNQGEMASYLNDNIEGDPPSGYSTWSEFLSSEVDAAVQNDILGGYGSVTGFVNSVLGLSIPDQGPCPPGSTIEAPFTSGGNSGNARGSGLSENSSMVMPPANTEADMDYFSGTIPGLGLDGPGASLPSPSAMEALQKVNADVNLYNGSQRTSIPLWTVQANDLSIPVSINSSNNGIKVDEMGTLLGQNWDLNAGGMISRVVKGLPDEFNGTTNGYGVGRTYKIKPRIELPSNMGLRVDFPGAGETCLDGFAGTKQNVKNGFQESISFGDSPLVEGAPINMIISWSPLQPNLVNFTIGIPVFQFFSVTVYLEVGFSAGISLNEHLGKIEYEETGLGFMHLDDAQLMDEFGLGGLNNYPSGDNPFISVMAGSQNDQLEVLRKKHSHKGIEDTKFFNDQVANWQTWMEAIEAEINGTYVYETKRLDTEPDEFYFDIGGYSGKFSFNLDGSVVVFPKHEGLQISEDIEEVSGQNHIVSFTITTPEGMQYSFGKLENTQNTYGVDLKRDKNYYLPNFYTYPEIGTGRDRFGGAEIDIAQMSYNPFFGPKKIITYGNTYDRNYKVNEGPLHSSGWHLTKVKSLLTLEEVLLDYDSRSLKYYSNKSYSHSFPDFGVENGDLKTIPNDELNEIHLKSTKWENGRAELAYSVTETELNRWHLTDIQTNRGEAVEFLYEFPRAEMINDQVCSRIEVKRGGELYKGWEMLYMYQGGLTSTAFCDDTPLTEPAPPAISMGGETRFNLGEEYEMQWFDYNSYFFINFSIGCFRIPLQIPFGFTAGVEDFGYRTGLYEYGSLMEVKALNEEYDVGKEESIFNAEKQRTFLEEIKEIDRLGGLHDFVKVSYINDANGLPKRFSVHQDLFGHYNNNSTSGSPLPPLNYTSILGTEITPSVSGAENHFGFSNVQSPGNMHLGHEEAADENRAKIGAIQTINLASGGSIKFEYELNDLSDSGADKGAGLRVIKRTEDPGDTPARVTVYEYSDPTFVNTPIRISQVPQNFYYRNLEGKVVSSSGYQNMVVQNKNNYIGYGTVIEKWAGTGSTRHSFTNPGNYQSMLSYNGIWAEDGVNDYGYKEERSGMLYWDFSAFGNPLNPNADPLPPSLIYPGEFEGETYLYGAEYLTEVLNGDETPRQVTTTDYLVYSGSGTSLKYFTSEMYQDNYPGSFWDNYIYRLVENFQPFGGGLTDDLVDFIANLIVGTILPHPYKRIERNYFVSERRLVPLNIKTTSSTTTNYFSDGESSLTTNFDYNGSPNPLTPKVVENEYSDGNKVRTEYFFGNETPPEMIEFDGAAISYLDGIGYLSPLFSRSELNGVLFEENFTSLKKEGGRVVPWKNWGLRDGTLNKIGEFTLWNMDGKPTEYELSTYHENGNGGGTFDHPLEFTWNERLQLVNRKYNQLTFTYKYNDYFELSRTTDTDGIYTEYEYEPRGRLQSVISLSGKQTETYAYTIAPSNNTVLSTLTFADGSHPPQSRLQTSDGFGKPLKLTRQNDGALLGKNLYDSFFRTVATHDITTGETLMTHEASPMSRISTAKDAEGNSVVTEQIKGDFFSASKVTDPNGHVSSSHSDGLGRLRTTVSGEEGSTKYFYDNLSRLDFILNPVGEIFDYTYNGMDKVWLKTVPGANEYTYWFDNKFRLTATKDGNGDVFVYEYEEEHDRLVRIYHHPPNTNIPTLWDGVADIDEIISAGLLYDEDRMVLENEYDGLKSWLKKTTEKIFSEDADETYFKVTTNTIINPIGQVIETEIEYPYGFVRVNTPIDDAMLLPSVTKDIFSPDASLSSISHSYKFDQVLRLEETTFDGEMVSRQEYNNQDLVKTKFLGQFIDPETGEEVFLQEVNYYYDKTGRLVRINDPYTMECFAELEICDLFGEFTVPKNIIQESESASECTPILTSILVDGQQYPVSPSIALGDIQNTPLLISTLEAALDYFGHPGEVTVETSYTGIFEITYEITVSNTSAREIELRGDGCEIGTLMLQGCCDTSLPNEVTGPDPGEPGNYDLFYEEITYSGIDISRIEYSSDCGTGKMRNDFTYDADHRVTMMDNAVFNPDRQDDWYTSSFTYDPAGNILTLKRNGMFTAPTGQVAYVPIDDLYYHYNTGVPGVKKLVYVDDLLMTDAQPMGFKPDIVYPGTDGNGNVLSSAEGSVQWNVINMPIKSTTTDGDVLFDYTFGGEKLRVQVPGNILEGIDPEDRLYLGGAEFVSDGEGPFETDTYQHEEGRKQYRRGEYTQVPLAPPPVEMQYQIADHLGNLAVLFSDADDDGHINSENEATTLEEIEVLQRHFYYPFGMGMDGTWTDIEPYNDRYKYNHKEQVKGLGWYAYGFRHYDATIGRFAGVDPISDQFAHVSTFNYAENSPIRYIDLHGLQAWEIKNDWNQYYINQYSKYLGHLQSYNQNGCEYSCDDLPIFHLLTFAKINKLPVSITNGSGTLSASDKKYNDFIGFYQDVASTTGARDLQNGENTVSLDVGIEALKNSSTGDLLLNRGTEGDSEDIATHVQVVTGKVGSTVNIMQGNFDWLSRQGIGDLRVGGSSDPLSPFYVGSIVQFGVFDISRDIFSRENANYFDSFGTYELENASDVLNLERRNWNFLNFNQ